MQHCFRVELNPVKAHNDYTGNERVDELARNAVYNNIIQFNIDPPHSYSKKHLKESICAKWTKRWKTRNTRRMTKLFYPHPNRGKSKALIKMSRNKARRVVEIRTGQNNLHYIQNKFNRLDLLCRFCEEEEETFDHFLFECPCFETQRREMNFVIKRELNTGICKPLIIFPI